MTGQYDAAAQEKIEAKRIATINATAKEIETALRRGETVKTTHGDIQFRGGRFYMNNIRISVNAAREIFLEIAETEEWEAFFDDEEG